MTEQQAIDIIAALARIEALGVEGMRYLVILGALIAGFVLWGYCGAWIRRWGRHGAILVVCFGGAVRSQADLPEYVMVTSEGWLEEYLPSGRYDYYWTNQDHTYIYEGSYYGGPGVLLKHNEDCGHEWTAKSMSTDPNGDWAYWGWDSCPDGSIDVVGVCLTTNVRGQLGWPPYVTFSVASGAGGEPDPVAPELAYTFQVSGMGVQFDFSSTTDDTDAVEDISVDVVWGEGPSTTVWANAVAYHTYENPGVYGVGIIATDTDGLTDAATQLIEIEEGGVGGGSTGAGPTVVMFWSKDGLELSVNGLSSVPSEGEEITGGSIDWGDESALHDTYYGSHYYAEEGVYLVTLSVTDGAGTNSVSWGVVMVAGLEDSGGTDVPDSPALEPVYERWDEFLDGGGEPSGYNEPTSGWGGPSPEIELPGVSMPDYLSPLTGFLSGILPPPGTAVPPRIEVDVGSGVLGVLDFGEAPLHDVAVTVRAMLALCVWTWGVVEVFLVVRYMWS